MKELFGYVLEKNFGDFLLLVKEKSYSIQYLYGMVLALVQKLGDGEAPLPCRYLPLLVYEWRNVAYGAIITHDS